MLVKRTKEIARAAGEAVGMLGPSVTDAQSAAEERRAELVAAQAAVGSAEAELDRLHDAGASPRDIVAAEARAADSKLTADRAQRAYSAAERRLAAAREGEAEKGKAAAIVARDAALERRAQAAQRIDVLAAELAEQVSAYDAEANALSEAAAAGVAARAFYVSGRDIVRHALERAGALPSAWIGERGTQPGAVEIAAKHASAVREAA